MQIHPTRDRQHAGASPSGSPSAALFAALFAVQSPQFVVAPVLAETARSVGASVAAVAQVRGVAGLAAAVTTLALGPLARRLGLRDLIALALGLVAVGSLGAAVAGGLRGLVLSHVALGAGLGVGLTSGLSAAGAWAPEGQRGRLLSHALMGPPAAAIVGTLVAGVLGGRSWRLAWLAVPLASSLLALVAILHRPADHAAAGSSSRASAWRVPTVPAWAVGELLAYSAWSAIVVFSGALLVQSYGVRPAAAGAAIAVSAAAFMIGNRLVRGRANSVESLRRLLVGLAPCLAVSGALLGAARPSYAVSAGLLVLLGLLQGARAHLGSRFGLIVAGRGAVAVMALRTTAQQLGYLVGAALGGLVLNAAGYRGLGLLVAVLVTGAAIPHAWALAAGTTIAPQGAEGGPS